MSNVNIKRVVENIRANTTVYTPIVEMIVNAIQAIESGGATAGRVAIRVYRDEQLEMDGGLSEVRSFDIEDNGVGFTDANREAFDTLYTDAKIREGGKGFGRFVCLKYFDDLRVQSVYRHTDGGLKQRNFTMGKDKDIIVNETDLPCPDMNPGTTVHLGVLQKPIDKKLNTIARNLVEKLLPYFISGDYACPSIVLSEADGTDPIRLNDFVSNELSAVIQELPVAQGSFALPGLLSEEEFLVRVFRLYFPKHQKSKISLVAHKREVSGSTLSKYIPEFSDDFYDRTGGGENHERNFIVKAYVFSSFLDRTVLLERSGFEFQMDNDALFGISQSDIESRAAEIAKDTVGHEIAQRQEKKRLRVQSYVDDEAPWHKQVASRIDLTTMPYNATTEEIDGRLQREKLVQDLRNKREVARLLADSQDLKGEAVAAIISRISEASKNDLVHYVALRRNVIDLFGKSLQKNAAGVYESEGVVHDIIFPRHGDTERTAFEAHNLWIIDERLNFTDYVSSDVPLNSTDRPDLLAYSRGVLFRGDNEPSNPITVFEFKKPKRDNFADPSAKEDPVSQILRYVNSIRKGEYTTPEGRPMLVGDNTPAYGYVICELTQKVKDWLRLEKDFKEMPDCLGWFRWFDNNKLYMEILGWDKLLKDAKMRNQIFFQKLGIG